MQAKLGSLRVATFTVTPILGVLIGVGAALILVALTIGKSQADFHAGCHFYRQTRLSNAHPSLFAQRVATYVIQLPLFLQSSLELAT